MLEGGRLTRESERPIIASCGMTGDGIDRRRRRTRARIMLRPVPALPRILVALLVGSPSGASSLLVPSYVGCFTDCKGGSSANRAMPHNAGNLPVMMRAQPSCHTGSDGAAAHSPQHI